MAENEKQRGGARPGAGRPKAAALDDDARCSFEKADGERCGNAAAVGSPTQRCRFHGGATTEVVTARKQAVVDSVTARIGIIEPVSVADFPTVAAEYVAAFNLDFARARARLEEIRASAPDEIEFMREYADITAEQKSTALVVVRLMEAAAKLGIAASTQQVADAIWSAEFGKIVPTILTALEPYPEARLAVATALGGPLPGEILPTSPAESVPADLDPEPTLEDLL
ncbi:hypothetical protein ACIRN4_23900 [Pimelobacter simplex]|uniref:hypothetical protein n=1 Tax=Nocardioides simplex TaxID=2045 RepID=UPI00382628C8